jgi:hypothetical protein
MTVPQVHLNTVNLHLWDQPLRYTPPVGPAVRFTVYYNHRDSMQPAVFTYSHMGPKWTSLWTSYILDNPRSPLSDVKYYVMGGGIDLFTGFDVATQAFSPQTYKQTQLHLRLRIRDAGPTWRPRNTCPTEQTLPPRASLPQLRAARASCGTTRSDGAGEHNFGGDRAPGGSVASRRPATSRSGRGRASARAEHRRTTRGASITADDFI